MLMVGVLGVTSVSGEYGTGMIRSTFAAVPKRWPVLVAKTVVTSVVVMVSSAVANLVAFLAAQVVLGEQGNSPSDPGAVRAVVGTAGLMTLIAPLRQLHLDLQTERWLSVMRRSGRLSSRPGSRCARCRGGTLSRTGRAVVW